MFDSGMFGGGLLDLLEGMFRHSDKPYQQNQDYIIEHWVEKDGEKFWAPEVKKEAKVQLKRIFKLMSSYKLECLLETIIEIDELWSKLEE